MKGFVQMNDTHEHEKMQVICKYGNQKYLCYNISNCIVRYNDNIQCQVIEK
jgi:hypothetical protein